MGVVTSIIARLGLDTTGFRSELSNVAGIADGAHRKMAASASKNTEAHENLLSSNHRVARQIQNFSRDLLSGASATDVFSAGLEGLERSLNLSLGSLAGIGISAVALQQIHKTVEEYEKLREEIEEVNKVRPAPEFQTLQQVTQHADEARAKVKELRKESESTFGQAFKDTLVGFGQALFPFGKGRGGSTGANVSNIVKNREKDLGETQGTVDTATSDELSKLKQKNALHDQPDFVAKAAAIEEQFFGIVQRLGQRGVVELEKELANLAADIARTRKERLQLSGKELAEGPGFGDQNSASLQAINNSENLRKAADLEKQAHDIVAAGGTDESLARAQLLQNQADNLRKNTPTLKESEKDRTGEFQGSIDPQEIKSELDKRRKSSSGIEEAQQDINRANEVENGVQGLDSGKDLAGAFKGAIEGASIFQQMLGALRGISFANQ